MSIEHHAYPKAKEDDLDVWYPVTMMAKHYGFSAGAIYHAIKNKRVVGQKIAGRWQITKRMFNEYRLHLCSRDTEKYRGVRIFDIETGRLTVSQTANVIASILRLSWPEGRVRLAIQRGELRAHRYGNRYVVLKEDIIRYLQRDEFRIRETAQLRFG